MITRTEISQQKHNKSNTVIRKKTLKWKDKE